VVVFASAKYNYEELLEALQAVCSPQALVGCSSSGEFISNVHGEGSASAMAVHSDSIVFTAAIGHGVKDDCAGAARQIADTFREFHSHVYPHRVALLLTDALAGYADDLVEQLTIFTAGSHYLFGGGAGDDGRFERTHVFFGTKAYTNSAVALEMLSDKAIGVGFSHGWVPVSPPMRITESHGPRIVSINAIPVLEVFQEHAEKTGQNLDLENPIGFFLHNALGIQIGDDYKLRVPLAVLPDGSVHCAAEVPEGATVCLMGTTPESASEAAEKAMHEAIKQIGGAEPKVAMFFDCVATRLRLGTQFERELRALQEMLGDTPLVGCNSHGQIARGPGQFNGYHNCTATVCVIGE
jgi:hypothetical protein